MTPKIYFVVIFAALADTLFQNEEDIGLNPQNSVFLGNSETMGNIDAYCVNWGEGEDSILYIDGHFSLKGKIKKSVFSHRFAYMLHIEKDLTCPVTCMYHIGVTIGGA